MRKWGHPPKVVCINTQMLTLKQLSGYHHCATLVESKPSATAIAIAIAVPLFNSRDLKSLSSIMEQSKEVPSLSLSLSLLTCACVFVLLRRCVWLVRKGMEK